MKYSLLPAVLLGLMFPQFSQADNRESGGRGGPVAVYISFSSFGSGIDAATLIVVQNLVKDAAANGLVLDQTFEQRGREGETMICAKIANPFATYQFIKSVAQSIKSDTAVSPNGNSRTLIYSSPECHDLRHATKQDLSGY